jgi:hypothetical protein
MNASVECERLAAELVALPLAELSPAEASLAIAGVICNATPDDGCAALDRAGEIMRERTAAAVNAVKHVESWKLIERLGNATLCPEGTSSVAWLEGLGLIEPDGAGAYVATEKAKLRAV